MKLVRFGAPGAERPGVVDAQGAIRDLSAYVPDFTGETATPILPSGRSGKPVLPETSSQVSPPSLERKSPLPGPPLDMFQKLRLASQTAANRMRGLLRSIEILTAPATSLRSTPSRRCRA